MIQRSPYRFALMSDVSDRGRPLLKFVKVRIPGFNLPSSPQLGNRNHDLETETALRDTESGNGNSIFRPQLLSL